MKLNPTPVRIPPDLKEYLQGRAKENHRSLSSEIVLRLEESRKSSRGGRYHD